MEGVWWGGSVDWRLGRAGCLTANVRYPACWCFSSRLAGRQYDNFAYRLQGPGMIPFVKLVVQPSTVFQCLHPSYPSPDTNTLTTLTLRQ